MSLCAFDEKETELWLVNIPEITTVGAQRLLRAFGTTRETFAAPAADIARIGGFTERSEKYLRTENRAAALTALLDGLEKAGAEYAVNADVFADSRFYPELLRHIPSPPLVLYYVGAAFKTFDDCPRAAIVGTRRPTDYGETVAYAIAGKCGESGITVVSGLAEGCDAAAHRGALDADGITAAVLGSGIDFCYPPSNRLLFDEIAEKGCLISELPLGARPAKWTFPRRNRVISGLCDLLIVAEAGEKSGAMITANLAAEQGREVFAVPGGIFSHASKGANRLIKNGANVLTDFDDILYFLSGRYDFSSANSPGNEPKRETRVTPKLDADEMAVCNALRRGGETIDSLLAETANGENGRSLDYRELSRVLLNLELKGVVVKLPGLRYKLKEGL